MTFTRIILIQFSLLSLGANAVPAAAAAFDAQYPSAEDRCRAAPWCNDKAGEKLLPKAAHTSRAVEVTNLNFKMKIPRDYEKLSVLGGALPHFHLRYKGYELGIIVAGFPEVEPIDDVELANQVAESKKVSRLTPANLFKIIFTSTANEPEPENLYDRLVWRQAFAQKAVPLNYGLVKGGEIYKNGKVTAYTVNTKGLANTRYTFVTHADNPRRYLHIVDRGAPKAVITELISSIDLDK